MSKREEKVKITVKRILLGSFILAAVAITSLSQRQATRTSSSQISENALRAHIKFLSDDRLEGRGTGAKGGERGPRA